MHLFADIELKDGTLYPQISLGSNTSPEINVEKALRIGKQMKAKFISNLPEMFHTSVSCLVKTMEMMKKEIKVSSYAVHDMETFFLGLITLGHPRHIELAPIFEFELCTVPLSLIDSLDASERELNQHLSTSLAFLRVTPLLVKW